MDIQISIALLALHVILGVFAHVIIHRNRFLNRKMKLINYILVWLMPLLWSVIAIISRRSTKLEIMTKENRSGNNTEHDDNWMHMTGGGD